METLIQLSFMILIWRLECGMKNQQVPWTRGRGLGATTLLNYMIITRGHKEDYDRIASAGNPGWSFDEVLPAFKRFENAKIPHFDGAYRSNEGELDIVDIPFKTECVFALMNASKEAGLEYMEDYNNGQPFGVSLLQANLRRGQRCDVETAFLKPAYKRKNLTVKTHATVTKLIIDKNTKTVTGVNYKGLLFSHTVNARKEVILSAGAYGSPQILMLSGIGPRKHLEELGIEVIQDLPVGEIIYDHLAFLGLVFTLEKDITPTFKDIISPVEVTKFLTSGTGHWTVPSLVIEALGFVKTPVSNETIDYPDAEIIFTSGHANTDYGIFFRREFGVSDEAYNSFFRPLNDKNVWGAVIFPYHPKSRGYMKLASTKVEDDPLLYARYFTDPENIDMKTMIATIRIVQKIAESPSIKRYGSKQHFGKVPGCEGQKVDSDEYWECLVRSISTSLWHQVSTCKMGPKEDKEAVVDNKLRVHGIKNLRVADTSIFPGPLTAHTNAPSIMVGEKAAEIILGAIED